MPPPPGNQRLFGSTAATKPQCHLTMVCCDRHQLTYAYQSYIGQSKLHHKKTSVCGTDVAVFYRVIKAYCFTRSGRCDSESDCTFHHQKYLRKFESRCSYPANCFLADWVLETNINFRGQSPRPHCASNPWRITLHRLGHRRCRVEFQFSHEDDSQQV